MALLTPGRRWQPPFFPFKKESFGKTVLGRLERWIKGPLYGCRMCGNCILQETAFICPMECPKGMRNGPCGGSTAGRCYVEPTRPCIWYRIYEKAHKKGREELLLEVLPPLDWDKVGTGTWIDVARSVKKYGTGSFVRTRFSKKGERRSEAWESVFRPIRQPEWWQGDHRFHEAAYQEPVSPLERKLRSGAFTVTAEVAPPLGTGTGKLICNIEMLKELVAAVNFTDGALASPRMSSISCSRIAAGLGADPVMQIAARDKTRSGLQSDIVGVNSMGIFNILCVTGDNARTGPTPTGNTNLLDMDAVQMLWILRRMRDEGIYLDGRKMNSPPRLFLGAAGSPFTSKPHFQALREEKKVNAGAQFFQTNLVFEPEGLDPWLEALDKRNVLDKVYILAGITPIRSHRMAQHLHHKVPGVTVPERIRSLFERTAEEDQEELGISIALQSIEKIKSKPGINGIHLMTVGCESLVPRIIADAGLN